MSEFVKMPFLKRLFDVVFSLLFIVLLSPFFILIFILIFFEHILRGCSFASLLYTEIRISQGKEFKFSKFNIFKPKAIEEAERSGEFIHTKKFEHDGVSTIFIGHILQKIYMDELPQLFSILKGDISFVGPRPVNLEVYESLINNDIETKTVIKAGLTGSYQSHKGEKGMSNLELDREYIDFCKNNSSWKVVLNDLKIMVRTIKILFRAQGI